MGCQPICLTNDANTVPRLAGRIDRQGDDHLEAGDSLEVFLKDFPSVSRELAVAVLEEARTALLSDAHPA